MFARKVMFVVLLLGAWLLPGTASAQQPQEGVTVNEVASELYCPLCTGVSVDVCDLEVCQDMRAEIAERLAAGDNPEQIKAYFVQQYGQRVLAKPPTQGFHLAAWLAPFALLLGAGAATVLWLRRRPGSPPVETSSPTRTAGGPPDEYSARLERELQRLDD